MAVWRRKALEYFPQLRRQLNRKEYSIYLLYFDLLPMSRAAHANSNRDLLRRTYEYAEWCLRQRSEALWNPAGVAFYEHLFDRRGEVPWPEVAAWLSPFVVWMVWGLWEWRLVPDDLQALRELFRPRVEFSLSDGRPRRPESQ
jgi:hypothetical protein